MRCVQMWLACITSLFHSHSNNIQQPPPVLYNLYDHAKQCDIDHQPLSGQPQECQEDDWWDQALPLFKRLWAADRTCRIKPPAWESFVSWYTDYIGCLMGNLNEKLEDAECWDLPFGKVAFDNNKGLLRVLCKLGVLYDAQLYSGEDNPLFYTRSRTIAKSLIAIGAPVNEYSTLFGRSVLATAASECQTPAALVKLYLKNGAEIVADAKGRNALHALCDRIDYYTHRPKRCLKKARLLIGAGIDIHAVDQGLVPLDILLLKRNKLRAMSKSYPDLDWNYEQKENNCLGLIELLESHGARSCNYIDADLVDLNNQECVSQYRRKELKRHEKDIRAMLYVLRTSVKQPSDVEAAQKWKTNRQVIKVFAQWYQQYADKMRRAIKELPIITKEALIDSPLY